MKYKLKHNLPHDSSSCLDDILKARGIVEIEKYKNPTSDSELSSSLLDNID